MIIMRPHLVRCLERAAKVHLLLDLVGKHRAQELILVLQTFLEQNELRRLALLLHVGLVTDCRS